MSTKTPKLVALTLYRNLLRAAKPFTAPSPHARVLNSLLNRTGIDDHLPDWEGLVVSTARDLKEQGGEGTKRLEGDKNIESTQGVDRKESIPPNQTSQRLFRRLLREVVCAGDPNGIAKSTWPSLVDPTILWNVIRREFRDGPSSHSVNFDVATRRQVAFRALRELNKKLCYFDHLEKSSSIPLPYQGASRVSPLPFIPSSEYLRPGVFLLAHPHMTGDSFFSKAVICILEHQDENKRIDGEDEESASKRAVDVPGLQTYGLIVNRASVHSDTGRNRTLKEAFEQQAFPGKLIEVFGDSIVREGGPVHVALQMLHSLPSSTDEDSSNGMSIGGRIIPVIPEDNDSSTALYSDRATYFQGEIFKAMAAVEDGRMDHGMIHTAAMTAPIFSLCFLMFSFSPPPF